VQRGRRTPSSSRPSRRWRGMIETSSISHMKAISGGVSPGGSGSAMAASQLFVVDCKVVTRCRRVEAAKALLDRL
jgi:hypothetical protein